MLYHDYLLIYVLFYSEIMTPSLMNILKDNTLTGDNYVTWKRKIGLLLQSEKHKFVLTTPKPPAPNNESSIMYRDEYEQWKTSDDMAKCYIMATISDVLQQQHEGMESAADIMMSLEEMFAMKSRTTKREAVTAFMNLRMKPGQAVKDHMMKVIAHLNIAELHGAEIDGETKIDMVVNSLSDSFDQFKLDYTLNKKEYTLQGLMQDVQSAEKILVKGKGQEIHMVGKVATVKARQKVKKQQKKKQLGPTKKETKKVTKIKGKCFLCGEKGHWKRNCPKSQNKKEQGNINYLETCFLADSTDSWIIDSGATNHVCYSLQGFQERRKLNKNEINLHLGNGTLVSANAVEDIRVYLDSRRHLDLIDVYYVPQFKRNLISVSCLNKFGYSVTFNKVFIISKNDKIICQGTLENGLYFLHRNISHSLDTEITEPNHKRVKLSTDETYLWHLRLGHINLNRIKRLVCDGPLSDLKVDDLPTCESCLEGKMTKRPFNAKPIEDDAEAKPIDMGSDDDSDQYRLENVLVAALEETGEADDVDYDDYPYGRLSDWSCITDVSSKSGPQYDKHNREIPELGSFHNSKLVSLAPYTEEEDDIDGKLAALDQKLMVHSLKNITLESPKDDNKKMEGGESKYLP